MKLLIKSLGKGSGGLIEAVVGFPIAVLDDVTSSPAISKDVIAISQSEVGIVTHLNGVQKFSP